MMTTHQWLSVIGLSFDFLGSFVLVTGLIISKKNAIKLGVSRISGSTDEENLKLIQVVDRLKQSSRAIIGLVLLFVGFVFQIIGCLLTS